MNNRECFFYQTEMRRNCFINLIITVLECQKLLLNSVPVNFQLFKNKFVYNFNAANPFYFFTACLHKKANEAKKN